MKKWQIGAVAGALVFSLFATGCGEQIDQNAGIATSAPATEAPTEAATAAPELTERAKKLLAQGMAPVDAALLTGFSDQSHFSNCFRRFLGVSPGIYRDIFTHKHHSGGESHGI